MTLNIVLRKSHRKGFCIVVTQQQKILDFIGISFKDNFHFDSKLFKNYLKTGTKVSKTVTNLIYKHLSRMKLELNFNLS